MTAAINNFLKKIVTQCFKIIVCKNINLETIKLSKEKRNLLLVNQHSSLPSDSDWLINPSPRNRTVFFIFLSAALPKLFHHDSYQRYYR